MTTTPIPMTAGWLRRWPVEHGRWIWFALALLLMAAGLKMTRMVGDGREYFLYASAFASHATPDIRSADVQSAKDLGFFKGGDFESIGRGQRLGSRAEIGELGLVRTAGGELYTWHFWLYPMVIAPLLAVFKLVGLPPLLAFGFGNGLMMMAALLYLWRWWGGSPFQKHVLSGCFLLGGAAYYIPWPHPEVYTACLVLLALMSHADRRPGLSVLCAGLAAAQNPPVLLLMLLPLVSMLGGLIARVQQHGSAAKSPQGAAGQAALALGGLVAALLPVAFYQAKLGVPNPIVAAGFTRPELIGFDRVWSSFFDVNMGMLPNNAGVAVLLVVACIAALGSRAPAPAAGVRMRAPWLPILLGIGLAVAMTLPTASALNWNHGSVVFSRYGCWLLIPLSFGVVVGLGRAPSLGVQRAAWCALGLQLAVVVYSASSLATISYKTIKPAAKLLFTYLPGLHNPVPEIFAERVMGREADVPLDREQAFYAFPSAGAATKLMVREQDAPVFLAAMRAACGGGSSTSPHEGGWVYVNAPIGGGCRLDASRVQPRS